MKKIIKYIVIAFVALMVLGGIIDAFSDDAKKEETSTTEIEANADNTDSEKISEGTEQQTVTPPTKQVTEDKPSVEQQDEQTDKQEEKPVEPTQAEDNAKLTDDKKAEIVAYFKGDDEPQVEDATFTSDTTLSLGMLDNGSNRDGFADYACQVLVSDFDVKDQIYIKIIDIAKLVQTDKWVKIGDKHCNS